MRGKRLYMGREEGILRISWTGEKRGRHHRLPGLEEERPCTVRLRHSRVETPALIRPDGGGVAIHTLAPARAPTPGQLAVFYDGDSVLGSGWIV